MPQKTGFSQLKLPKIHLCQALAQIKYIGLYRYRKERDIKGKEQASISIKEE